MTSDLTESIIDAVHKAYVCRVEFATLILGECDNGPDKTYWIDVLLSWGIACEESIFTVVNLEEMSYISKEVLQELKSLKIPHKILQRIVASDNSWDDQEISEEEI